MFGISQADLEKILRKERAEFDKKLATLETNFKRRLEDAELRNGNRSEQPSVIPEQIRFRDVTVTKEELVRDVVSIVEERLKGLITDAVGKIDLEELSDRLYQDIDNDELTAKVADLLKDKVFDDLEQPVVARAIAEVLNEEGSFDEDFMEQVASNVVEKLSISIDKDS